MSGETKWTKGPWVADGFFVSSNSGGAVGHDIVSACGTVGRPDSETEANAQLIAAAPDMYASLEEARGTIQALIDEGYTGHVDQRGRIDAALAKARGESQ